ncbi:MAG: DNA-binding protein [Angelakisella sp.]|nr:DNA-binding protein [Angelakisella sp.]
MQYSKEVAKKWGLTARVINYYCANGRIEGAQMVANVWLIPKDAVRPEERRKGNGRKPYVEKTKGEKI